MNKFVLLKQTYPISQRDRICDAYKFILDNTTKEDRSKFGINDSDLQQIILEGEKYLYRVGKENGKFKTMSISTTNYQVIRENFELFKDHIDE